MPARRRMVLLLSLVPLVAGLTLGTIAAEPSLTASTLSADAAQRLGAAITIVPHPEVAPGLAEVALPPSPDGPQAPGADRLLALGPDAGVAAVAQQIGAEPSALILARSDGSQLRVQMPGLLAAAFSPDGSWLAVLDGTGALWRVATATGAAARLAEGPFIGAPSIEAAGSVLALRVSSVEAPFVSRLVRVAGDGSSAAPVTDDRLVYGMQPLADGGLAVISHRPSGTVVSRMDSGTSRLLVDLGRDAIHVGVARAGDAVAWERHGETYLRQLPGEGAIRLATGGHPRFAPDGRAVLVDTADGSALIGIDGATLATFASEAAFAQCGEGCGS